MDIDHVVALKHGQRSVSDLFADSDIFPMASPSPVRDHLWIVSGEVRIVDEIVRKNMWMEHE
jgi:hypothetical protein